ncbi:MAG: ECF transporter S component [Aeriscardovia sp.]|nr:ECF transporter S component [Aeriscardovia sp.]MBQ5521023.1 ECF transporter S component [Aeriscardovia sp.]MBQ5556932.1 ECF transporter S component [Aeriscardovia sp.]
MKVAVKGRVWRWRVVDISTASCLGVACGIVFWAADFLPFSALQAILPGLGGFLNGLWLFAAPLCAVIIRKPGAALFCELLASVLEALMGNIYGGASVIIPGFFEGLGAEIVFAFFFYRVWNLWTACLASLLSGFFCWAESFLTDLQAISFSGPYGLAYLLFTLLSAFISGLGSWYIYKAIARTGALDRFASGRAGRSV